MCVVSMVHDHYEHRFDPPISPRTLPFRPLVQPLPMVVPPESVLDWADVEALKKLIAEFKEALAAAKKVDKLTGQPDCLDPAKAGLEKRVKKLEAQIKKLERQTKPIKSKIIKPIKSKKPTKKSKKQS